MPTKPRNLIYPAAHPRSGIRWAACVGAFLVLTDFASAASPFPRGPGLTINPVGIILFYVAFLIWSRMCSWADQDARRLGLETNMWSPLIFTGGIVGLGLCWIVPPFIMGYLLTILFIAGPFGWFVFTRNSMVPKEEWVFTRSHMQRLLRTTFGVKVDLEVKEKQVGPDVIFMARGRDADEGDMAHLKKAMKSRGYLSAMELVYDAVDRRATDIHLEPRKEQFAVRYRVDGMLHAEEPFERQVGDAVVNVFKVLAVMDISEKRKPQDGGFSAKVDGRSIDFRAASQGTTEGEKLSLRILDKSKTALKLTDLGMRDKSVERVRGLAADPHGMLIAAGPTGAGKSTSLYAILREIDRYTRNVITIEDPIEYHLDEATQIQVNTKAGQTFAASLRSVLRQDPDIIMIGEIRDQETAQIACQAATTGHLVFTTIHANDSIQVLFRLLSLKVEPMLVSSAVSAIWSQRLVRLLCPKCKVKYKPNPQMLRKANLPVDKIKFFCRPPKANERGKTPKGVPMPPCEYCIGTGYRGRTGVFEVLRIDEPMRELIRQGKPLSTVKQRAVKTGMTSLQDEAMRLVIRGQTSVEEILRVLK